LRVFFGLLKRFPVLVLRQASRFGSVWIRRPAGAGSEAPDESILSFLAGVCRRAAALRGGEGVSRHPDLYRDRHERICRDCGGAGEIAFDAGGNGDPQDEDADPCLTCAGTGWEQTWTDPLVLLRQVRAPRSPYYQRALRRAFRRSPMSVSKATADHFNALARDPGKASRDLMAALVAVACPPQQKPAPQPERQPEAGERA
jgi:hypothetical protein